MNNKASLATVLAFCDAVYPNYPNLAIDIKSEESILCDATELLIEYRTTIVKLKHVAFQAQEAAKEQLRQVDMWKEAIRLNGFEPDTFLLKAKSRS